MKPKMLCAECGREVNWGDRVCANCGKPVEWPADMNAGVEEDVPAGPQICGNCGSENAPDATY